MNSCWFVWNFRSCMAGQGISNHIKKHLIYTGRRFFSLRFLLTQLQVSQVGLLHSDSPYLYVGVCLSKWWKLKMYGLKRQFPLSGEKHCFQLLSLKVFIIESTLFILSVSLEKNVFQFFRAKVNLTCYQSSVSQWLTCIVRTVIVLIQTLWKHDSRT